LLQTDELVFVQGVGFRASSGRVLTTPISADRGEWSVTIERLMAGPDKTELRYALSGPAEGEPPSIKQHPSPPSWFRDPVTLLDGDGRLVPTTPEGAQGGGHEFSYSFHTRQQSIRRIVTFEPLAPDSTRVEVVLEGKPGPWSIPIELSPSTTYGLPARRLDVSDSHHGAVIAARAVATDESMTAIDVRTALDPTPQPRFMRSLGVKRWDRGDGSQFLLSDDTGLEVGEFAVFDDSVVSGRELHQILVFPAQSPNAKRAVLTIPELTLAETTGTWVTLAVPSETDIELGRHRVHASVARGQSRRGDVVRVTLDDGGWREGRRVLYAESVRVDGVLRGVSARPEPGAAAESEDPSGSAREIAIETPVLLLRGPWRLEISL
jgi:hypothetical protein